MTIYAIFDSDFIQAVTFASFNKLDSLMFPPILPVHIAFLATVPLGVGLEDPVQVLVFDNGVRAIELIQD